MCIPLSLLGNGLVKTLLRQPIHTKQQKNYWTHCLPCSLCHIKESRQLVLPRIFCFTNDKKIIMNFLKYWQNTPTNQRDKEVGFLKDLWISFISCVWPDVCGVFSETVQIIVKHFKQCADMLQLFSLHWIKLIFC